MTEKQNRRVVFPGTFDPLTKGHLDVIHRACRLFDELIVAVGDNPDKTALIPQKQRADIIRQIVAELPNVRVETFSGLTVDMARQVGAEAIIRGIRNSSDLQFELQVAMTNRAVAGVETVFVMTSAEFAFTSSSLIKQIARMGGDVSSMVPPQVLPYIRQQCGVKPAADDSLKET